MIKKSALNRIPADLAVVLVLTSIFLFSQIFFLHLAANPFTDEGTYAAAGLMMLSGLTQHIDFGFWHMPLLALFEGIGLKIFSDVYYIRLICLLFNTSGIIVLFLFLKRINPRGAAAIFAVLFYMLFFGMVYTDFRFPALRQIGNTFIIYFLFATTLQKRSYRVSIQGLIAVCSGFLFLPLTFFMFFIGLADTFIQKSRIDKWKRFGDYAFLGLITGSLILIYFLIFENSFQQIVLDQFQRGGMDRIRRIGMLFAYGSYPDGLVLSLGCLGLLSAHLLNDKRLSLLAAAMTGIVLVSIFLSTNFFYYYITSTGPALAFGIFCIVLIADYFCDLIKKTREITMLIMCGLLFVQLLMVFPKFVNYLFFYPQTEYYQEYYDIVEVLRESKEPVFSLEAMYPRSCRKTIHA